jgi:hypothetical protein
MLRHSDIRLESELGCDQPRLLVCLTDGTGYGVKGCNCLPDSSKRTF